MKPGYKRTEVGVIPKDWEVRPLDELSDKIMVGIASAATHAYRDRGVVMFRNQNIKPGYLDDTDILYIAEKYEITYRNKRLKTGDLLTARTGYPGTTCIVPAQYEGAQSFTTLITRLHPNVVDSTYLCCFINSRAGQTYFDQTQIGGGQKNVNAGSLKYLPVILPPTLAEQEAIASALGDADALIESLERLIAKKRDIKQGAMQQLLTGNKRLPGFTGKWETKRLCELGEWKGGMTPSMTNPDYWLNGSVPWISSGDVKSVLLQSTGLSVTLNAIKQGKTTLLPVKSIIVVTRSGILRKTLPVAMNLTPMAINQDIKALIPRVELCSEYLLYALIGNAERILSRCLKAGTTVESVEFRWLKSFTIQIPSYAEQIEIASVLSDMDAEIGALEERLLKARAIKQGMMQELLTGRIRLECTQKH